MKDVDFDKVNRYLTEKATICPKEMKKEEKPSKKVQKDEMEDEKEEEEREVKNFKALDKIVTKLSEYLTKTEDEKALKAVQKIAELVGTELETEEDED
jgi:hypothetical protein